MLLPLLSCYRISIKKITTHNNLRLISNVPFSETFTLYNYKDNILIRKFNDINDWYIRFTGLDEVKRLQDKVITTQERLEKVQEERRQKGKIIVDVRKDATVIQEQLHQVKKWENVDKFVDLTQKEAELIKKERELTAQFEVLDKEERELFSTLCNTIRDSHEKEKAQSEYTKYWGIILSIVGTIVGAVVSTIISTIRNRQIIVGINKNVEEKFHKIADMYKKDILSGSYEKNISLLLNENRNNFKCVEANLLTNIKETKTLRDDTNKIFMQFVQVLNKNLNDINNVIQANRSRYLLSIDDIRDDDKFIDLTTLLQVNQMQQEQSFLPILTGFIGVGIAVLLLGCICR